jgi:hypothetical protein
LNPSGDWSEYQRLVLSELAELKKGQDGMRQEVAHLRETMAELRVKSGVWGALAGAVPAAILLVIHFLSGKRQ